MRKNEIFRSYPIFSTIITTFVTAEISLTTLVVTGVGSVRIEQYSAICLACLFSLLFLTHDPRNVATFVALAMTVLADTFFVICRPMLKLPAMLAFSVVQLAYFMRLLRNIPNKRRKYHIVLRAAFILFGEGFIVCFLQRNVDALVIVSVHYYVNILLNCVMSWTEIRESRLFALGLLLFVCCDTLIGLKAASEVYLTLPHVFDFLFSTEINLPWLFYIPSQTLIALSVAQLVKNRHLAPVKTQNG